MPSEKITVRMLGGFSLEWRNHSINDQSNRMRKVWLLLAYLICNRTQHILPEHYTSLLQGKASEDSADPSGSLKAMFYRLRAMLDQLGDSAGHDLIVRKSGSYTWNTEIPLVLDAEEFEQLCRKAEESEDPVARLALYQQALELYRGDFLPKLSSEAWVIPISTYYHQLYLDIALKTLSILEEHGRWEEVTSLCEKALKIEAYDERIYQSLMRCKLALGDRSAVLSTYEEMSELLFSTFGVMPSDESRSLYRQAMRGEDSLAIPVGSVREDLKESGGAKGALFCEYDFFKILYQAQARALIRSGETIHIALFSVHGYGKKELSRRSLDRAMENLQELIVSNLRQGDIVTKCSVSQLIVMLPQANYENSCAVCQRLIKSFFRQYPHSPVDIHFSVQPLEPMEPSAEKTQRS